MSNLQSSTEENRMTRPLMALLWALLIDMLAAPIIYAIVKPTGKDFIDNIMSGWFSTAFALVGGIPVALWLDRAIKHREEVKRQQEDRKREIEVLELLREELSYTDSLFINDRKNRLLDPPPIQPLKSDFREAASAAGKLNLISNHRLLNRITSAYYLIKVVRKIEEQAYISSRSVTSNFRAENAQHLLKTQGHLISPCLTT